MRWTLGRVALSCVLLALVAVMCAGYVGGEALLGMAVLLGGIGFVLLVVRSLR